MPLSNDEIKEVLAIIDESGWDEAQVTVDDVTVVVSKNGAIPPTAASPAPASPPVPPAAAPAALQESPAPPAAEAAPAPSPGEHLVTSPSVGVFWRAPEPGAAPFVEVGDTVEAGQTVCIVEVMKLMQNVVAEVGGIVSAIHLENSEPVEFGSPLVSIAPADRGA